MKIWRRGHISIEHKPFLEENGITHDPWPPDYKKSGIASFTFVVTEDHPCWPELKERLAGSYTYIGTEFTTEDIISSEWCMARAKHSIQSLRLSDYAWSKK